MKESIKDKIEKLLNLSMSDNEHEAKLALDRALKLMGEHNITKDEVYRQNFISKDTILKVKRVPSWMIDLYSSMANIAGCIFTWRNGYYHVNAKGSITGRERDVENAMYLVEFLSREIEVRSTIYMNELKSQGLKSHTLKSKMQGFKKGIIKIVFKKLYEQQNKFFNQQEQEYGLVCIDLESRIKESTDFLNGEFSTFESKSKSKVDRSAESAGILAGNKIQINQAVHGQKEVRQLEV